MIHTRHFVLIVAILIGAVLVLGGVFMLLPDNPPSAGNLQSAGAAFAIPKNGYTLAPHATPEHNQEREGFKERVRSSYTPSPGTAQEEITPREEVVSPAHQVQDISAPPATHTPAIVPETTPEEVVATSTGQETL